MYLHMTARFKSIIENQEKKKVVKQFVSNSEIQQRPLYTYRYDPYILIGITFKYRIKLLLQYRAKELLYASSTQPKPHFTALTGNIN